MRLIDMMAWGLIYGSAVGYSIAICATIVAIVWASARTIRAALADRSSKGEA